MSKIDALEREIAETRADLDDALDMLQAKMTPSALIDQAFGHARKNPSVMASSMGQMYAHRPLTTLLMSAGVNWYLSRRAKKREREDGVYDSGADRHRVRELAGRAKARAQSAAEQAKEGAVHLNEEAHHLRDAASDRLHDIGEKASERIHAMKDSGMREMHDLRDKTREESQRLRGKTRRVLRTQTDRATELFTKQPLLIGALLTVAGAAIAAVIPATAPERRAARPLSSKARRLKRKAEKAVVQGVERGASMAATALNDAATKIEENMPGKAH